MCGAYISVLMYVGPGMCAVCAGACAHWRSEADLGYLPAFLGGISCLCLLSDCITGGPCLLRFYMASGNVDSVLHSRMANALPQSYPLAFCWLTMYHIWEKKKHPCLLTLDTIGIIMIYTSLASFILLSCLFVIFTLVKASDTFV